MGRQLMLFLIVLSLVQTSWQVNHNEISADRVKRSDDLNLQNTVAQQAAALQALQAQFQTLQAQQTASQTELNNAKAQIASLQSKVSKPVAFTVRFSADDAVHGIPIQHNDPLRFDAVVLNTGNGYDVQTGMFTAPVAGTYCFFVTLMGVGTQPSSVQIAKNGAIVDIAYAVTHEDQGSSLVTVHLAQSDRVWIRHGGGVSLRGGWWTVFTGYLLLAD